MGANLSEEQQARVKTYLGSQDKLIEQLKGVVEQQARALQQLSEDDDDYDAPEQDHDGDESGDEEFSILEQYATAAESKEGEPEVDDAEKQEPDQQYQEPTEEEERNFAATKPWLGAMAPPSNYKKDSSWDEAPDRQLQLEYVHGYRSRLCRNNVYWIDSNRLVYFSAAVGIVHNLENNTQQFFFGHTDDILCLDYHCGKKIACTGEQGKTPTICVWDVETRQLLATMSGYHKRGVIAIAFSADGSKIVSVGLDDNHSVAVYDWQSQQLVAESKGDTAKIIACIFNRAKDGDPNTNFVTVGSKHIKFWTIEGGRLTSKKGLLGRKGKRQAFVTVGFTEKYTLVGCQSGDIYGFHRNKLKKVISGHNGMIYCIRSNFKTFVTGGKDGLAQVWDCVNFKKIRSFDMNKHDATDGKNSVRAIDFLDQNTLACGCITSNVYRLNITTGCVVGPEVTGHFGNLLAKGAYGELWALSPSPNPNIYATACEDRTLRIWDVAQRKQIQRIELCEAALSCAWSPDCKLIAVGFQNGAFSIVEVDSGLETFVKRSRRRRLPCIKFSPCGQFLAVGTAECAIDIYRQDGDNWKRAGTAGGSSSVIMNLDWSKDSKWIQCVSQAYELLFYDQNGKHNPRSRQLKDEQWATQECILGWNVQGIWPKYSDGSDVNRVNRSNSEKYLASAEDSGLVKLFNYPCIGSGLDRRGKLARRPQCHRHSAHSSHVTNVAWTADDQYVISCGGADLMVAQWKVVSAQ